MPPNAIALRRLLAQRLIGPPLASPHDTVRWMGAIQAQEYAQSAWAIGARTNKATAESIEQAVRDRQIVRTWTMRGTIHFVPARDAGWIVALCATRQIKPDAPMYRSLSLDSALFDRCGDLLRAHLQQPMSRPDIFAMLQRHGVTTEGQRGYHILVHHAHRGLITLGPMAGKQPTAVLLDSWVPDPIRLTPEEALTEFARRYFASHGPASIRDFATWTGLSLTEARRGHAAIRDTLVEFAGSSEPQWMHASMLDDAIDLASSPVLLLPAFEEYLLGYKDRSAVLRAADAASIAPSSNGVFKPIIVEHGDVSGIWSRTQSKAGLSIELTFFSSRRRRSRRAIDAECERVARFLGVPLIDVAFA